ncbi:protein-methionine-sulfoxide reductase catalytic subunit MsrP [Siculibacillus lacustris]|uniref:Protein-methionine-sulfoxide reductase catalytic subunit MsrP n=1 Tax=Siculibacillus lacustris TaxID=1549641 RepID=A0A4Q9VQ75_9HYPH|nr:protein-methionine-sulfoxide reductase catalytic subunit MsrP [Siculibacillus lacustris]TBW37670.1 protein-methionine-sulfoxide reductase catalytic subunit MsrP [Siculibacillus lacustris]
MIRRRRSWNLSEAEVTPEALFLDRRRLLAGLAGGIAGAAFAGLSGPARAAEDPLAGLLPAARNAGLSVADPLTPEAAAGSYNNFYEFGFSKSIVAASKKLPVRPWRIVVDGLCDTPFEIDIDDLLKKVTLEERICRHRCVEAWSMVVPWTGFKLAELVAMAGPKAEAKYLRMETFLNPKVAPYQSAAQYPWPYVEGLTLAEATNELAFLAVGIYGKPMPTQHGAPLRLVTPWKYGFKSAKSLVKFSFVAKRPETFWSALGPSEYGFWANVNPDVAHPRWSQKMERRLGPEDMVATRIWNGYGEQVAGLYKDLAREKLYM